MSEFAPRPALVALAALVRSKLAELGDRLEPAVPQAATTIVAAAAPFAPTSFARLRLIRQLHACGLLTSDEARRTERVLALAAAPDAAPGAPDSDAGAGPVVVLA